MIKAVIFDCFGVLYPDTYWTIVRRHTLGDVSKEIVFHDLIAEVDLGAISREDFWDAAAKLLGITRPELDAEVKKLGQLDDELMEYIAKLKKQGLKTSIISNVGIGFIERVFAGYDQAAYFDDMVLSSQVGLVKPDPAIYTLAADRLGLPPEACVFIDDIPRNAEGAEQVGMKGLVYHSLPKLVGQLDVLLKKQ